MRPPAPSEEDALNTAATNANFGPQDVPATPTVPVIAAEAGKVPTGRDIVYNVTFDVSGAVPAGINEIDGSAANSNATPASQPEWTDPNNQDQVSDINSAPGLAGLDTQSPNEVDTEVDTQASNTQASDETQPDDRVSSYTRQGQLIRSRNRLNLFSAKTEGNIKQAFTKETNANEAQELHAGRSVI